MVKSLSAFFRILSFVCAAFRPGFARCPLSENLLLPSSIGSAFTCPVLIAFSLYPAALAKASKQVLT
ncbi:hypothetical protein [uncultured Mailhella sp.]|uniref:hypothetical protein n=1 Tax=uncultured Mailhella sp. TaxID=1981031 RepID=UPI00320B3947